MRRKIRAGIAIGTIIVLCLSGCGSGEQTEQSQEPQESQEAAESQETALPSGTVELTVWAEADSFDMMNEMIDGFKAEYSGQADFQITLAEQDDSLTKDTLLGDIHNGADIFTLPDDQLPSMIAAGVLSPVASAEEVKGENMEDAVLAASYNDTLYAYPYTADNGYFLYYDKEYLSEADVQTMDGILAAAGRAGKKMSMEFNSGWYLYSFFGGTGLEFGLNDDGVTNYCNWNTTEGAITGVDVAKALLDITGNSAFVAQLDAGFIEGAQNGSVVAGISGAWNAMDIKEAWGEDYGACKLPTYTVAGQQVQMSSFTGYKMMGVNAYSENVEWAHKLAQWMTNEQNQTLRFEVKNQGPSNVNAAASEAVSQVPAIQALIQQSEYGTLQRVGNNYWDPCTEFAEAIAAGNPGNKPLQELMDNLVNGITASTVQ